MYSVLGCAGIAVGSGDHRCPCPSVASAGQLRTLTMRPTPRGGFLPPRDIPVLPGTDTQAPSSAPLEPLSPRRTPAPICIRCDPGSPVRAWGVRGAELHPSGPEPEGFRRPVALQARIALIPAPRHTGSWPRDTSSGDRRRSEVRNAVRNCQRKPRDSAREGKGAGEKGEGDEKKRGPGERGPPEVVVSGLRHGRLGRVRLPARRRVLPLDVRPHTAEVVCRDS